MELDEKGMTMVLEISERGKQDKFTDDEVSLMAMTDPENWEERLTQKWLEVMKPEEA